MKSVLESVSSAVDVGKKKGGDDEISCTTFFQHKEATKGGMTLKISTTLVVSFLHNH